MSNNIFTESFLSDNYLNLLHLFVRMVPIILIVTNYQTPIKD